MTIRCHISIEGGSTVPHVFLVVPRIGEIIFVAVGGSLEMFRVLQVNHFAEGASRDDPSASISLNVTRNDVLSSTRD